MTLQWLLGWWNLIFILPFGLGLLYLGLYTLSGWTFGDADGGGDVSIDHDLDAQLDADGNIAFEHDADLSHDPDLSQQDVNVSAEAGADTDGTDTDSHAAHESESSSGSSLLAVLNWLGVGRVPLSLVMMILLLSWGAIGFAANRLLIDRPQARATPLALVIALAGSLAATRLFTSAVARFLPTSQTYARRRHELLGSMAEALYPIDATFGMVCGRDDRGEQFQVACRTSPNSPPIAKGTAVQLVAYTAKERLFFVVPVDAGSGAAAKAQSKSH